MLEIEDIDLNDDFFALGGNSLQATQAVARTRERFLIDLPAQTLFEYPTVASLAQHVDLTIRNVDTRLLPAIQPADRDLPLQLSFSQERLWLIYQLQPDNSAYNIPTATRIKGTMNILALEQAINLMIQRHEILRTIFYFDGHRPLQKVIESYTIKIQSTDLQDVPNDQLEAKYHPI